MLRFSTTLTIQRPLSAVFAYWSEPDHIPAWQGGVVSYRRLSDGPPGLGTRYTVVRKALGLQQETNGEYTAFEADRRLVESVQAGPARYTIETTFTAGSGVGGATTQVSVATEISLGGALGRLGEAVALRPIRSQAEADHARIKALLESSPTMTR